jgi:hypothetical protein
MTHDELPITTDGIDPADAATVRGFDPATRFDAAPAPAAAAPADATGPSARRGERE